MSRLLKHGPCPKCGSSDALAIYSDHEYCFSFGCGHYLSYDKKVMNIVDKPPNSLVIPLPPPSMPALEDRGIDATTINKYQVSTDYEDVQAVFPRFNSDGEHVANQIRYHNKKFKIEGSLQGALLFGQHLFPSHGKSITITEGYFDTLAAFSMTGQRYPNVGVMSASTAKKEIVDNFEYLESFEKIIINFDNDVPGQKAAKECAQLFSPGKAFILCLSKIEIGVDEDNNPIYTKDSNDFLRNGLGKEYVNEWFRASPFLPDGLKIGTELWEDVINHKTPESVPYPWQGLNSKTYGLRESELVLITADTGSGKTTVCKEIEYALLTNPELISKGCGVGFLHLEEPKYDTAIGLMSLYANKPYHLPDTERTEQELREAFDKTINTERVVIWDHFGSNDVDVVLSKIRHMAALGCKYIVLDHLSIIVSDQRGDERKQLDEISTKIKTLTMNLGISCICVIHINRQGLVRGSAGPEQVANIVIRLERDKKDPSDWRRNITKVSVEKNRFCGRTGPACYLFYNEITNRLEELTEEDINRYEHGDTGAGYEFS